MKNLKLKFARAALNLSQQDPAEKVGVSRQTINAIEKGDYNPTINLCRAICKALGKTWMNCSGRSESTKGKKHQISLVLSLNITFMDVSNSALRHSVLIYYHLMWCMSI